MSWYIIHNKGELGGVLGRDAEEEIGRGANNGRGRSRKAEKEVRGQADTQAPDGREGPEGKISLRTVPEGEVTGGTSNAGPFK